MKIFKWIYIVVLLLLSVAGREIERYYPAAAASVM